LHQIKIEEMKVVIHNDISSNTLKSADGNGGGFQILFLGWRQRMRWVSKMASGSSIGQGFGSRLVAAFVFFIFEEEASATGGRFFTRLDLPLGMGGGSFDGAGVDRSATGRGGTKTCRRTVCNTPSFLTLVR
jgi:hypothetical protein